MSKYGTETISLEQAAELLDTIQKFDTRTEEEKRLSVAFSEELGRLYQEDAKKQEEKSS